MITVTIIGPGRIGGALALSLPKDKYRIDRVVGRGGGNADKGFGPVQDIAECGPIESDVLLITTTDPEIAEAASALAEHTRSGLVVFHTSGALTSNVMSMLKPRGCLLGSIHPLVSISRPEDGGSRFSGAYFCVEGVAPAVEMGLRIVTDLDGKPFTIETAHKTLYHAGAVMACGHMVALFDSAVEVLTNCGLSPEESKKILLPLVASTVENLRGQSTSSALTGTFGRADIETFSQHLKTLNENVSDDLLEIYLLLGERSLELASREGVNPERIDKLRAKMSVAKSRLKW